MADHAIARLGVTHVPEGRGVFPNLTVRDNLLMEAYAVRDDLEAGLERVYRLFPVLAERRDQVAWTLSGGEQQMLSLASAIVTRPRLLMVDELSLGLGPLLVAELFKTVERIRSEGTTILLVEQYVVRALRLADIVVILHKGRIQFVGEPGELAHEEKLVEAYLGKAGTESYAITGRAGTGRPKRRKAARRRRAGRDS
jgi:branched-chain amino acid transport system ATP-binding protein